MRITHRDLKHGLVKVKLEYPEDGWRLASVIDPGDVVGGRTPRRVRIKRGADVELGERRLVNLKLAVETVEFHEYTGRVRITGKIVEGPEEAGSGYHTIEVAVGKILSIQKKEARWADWQLERLSHHRPVPIVLVCVMDERESTIAEIGEKITVLTVIRGGAGKAYPSAADHRAGKYYYSEIMKFLLGKTEEKKERDCYYHKIIIAGPGFAKDKLITMVKSSSSDLAAGKIIMVATAHTGEPGIHELVKRGELERILGESRLSEETELVESFLAELAKDNDMVAYGKKAVEEAVGCGAVRVLLVSEPMVREFEPLMKATEKHGGEVKLISKEHQSGEKLFHLGGIAAFLRYPILLR